MQIHGNCCGDNLKCSRLFIFLACRFLGQPDGVIDCESVHGRWKWIMDFKTGTKHKLINAILKISARMLHYEGLPPDDRLHRHILDVRANMNVDLEGDGPQRGPRYENGLVVQRAIEPIPPRYRFVAVGAWKSAKDKNTSWSNDRSIYMRSL